MKVIVQVEMNLHVNVEFIATNVRPIRSENFEQRIRQCAWFHRDVALLKRDCRISFAINSVAIEAGFKRASFTWSFVVESLPLGGEGPCRGDGKVGCIRSGIIARGSESDILSR